MRKIANLSRRQKIAALSATVLLCLGGVPVVAAATGADSIEGAYENNALVEGHYEAAAAKGKNTPPPGKPPAPPKTGTGGGPKAPPPNQPYAKPQSTPAGSTTQFCETTAGGGGWSQIQTAGSCAPDKVVTCQWDAGSGKWTCVNAVGWPVQAPASFCQAQPGLWPCGSASTGHANQPIVAVAVTPSAGAPAVAAQPPVDPAVPPVASPPPGVPAPGGSPAASPVPSTAVSPTVSPTVSPSVSPTANPAAKPARPAIRQAVASARAAGMEPWLDVDLSGAYLQGKTAYENAIEQVVAEAALPGVVGVKYAASVGFSGFSTADQARDFLTRTHRVLRTRLPWHRLAVEVVAPELGCGQNTACVRAMRAAYPLVTAAEVTRYLQAVRGVDRIYVASGLFTAEYGKHKITYGGKVVTPSEAQWLGVHARGWGSYGQIASREYSLAQPSGSAARDRKTIAKLIAEQITKPVRQRGIQSITLWGHHLTSGKTGYQLLDAGPLWQALLAQNARRTLSVVVSPGPAGAITDLDQLGQGFQEIFILG